MTIASKLQMLAAIKAAQYEAIIAKGGTLSPGDWSAYAAAIEALPTGGAGVPAMIADMPFEIGDEPLTGTIWYVKPGGTGNQDGSSWDHAFATRQQAVNAASPGDQIRVWEGTYYLDQIQTPKAGVSEYYGFNGDGSWSKRQPFTHPSIHDAQFTSNNFTNSDQVFIAGQIIDGFWIQHVVSERCILASSLSAIKNSTVLNGLYGGIEVSGPGSTIENSFVGNCYVPSKSVGGGGIRAFGTSPQLRINITNCKVINCLADGIAGGIDGQNLNISGCYIANCESLGVSSGGRGGGAAIRSGGLIEDTIAVNCACGSNGGGFSVSNSATVKNSLCINCVSNGTGNYGQGGGIHAGNSISLINNTCVLCAAESGSGIYAGSNVLLYNNAAYGCNIFMGVANAAYEIYNCASDNALTGIADWDTIANVQNFVTLTDFPFAAAGVPPWNVAGAFNSGNAIGQSEPALKYVNDVVIPSMANAHLPAGSPLIGAGYYEAGITPETDADGVTRPIPPSIGAYEP